MRRINKQGDVTTPLLMWFVGIIVAIVLVTWYFKASSFDRANIAGIDEDVKNIHYELALACANDGIVTSVPLRSTSGRVQYNSTILCIMKAFASGNVTRCLPTPCDIATQGDIDISEVRAIKVEKNSGTYTLMGEQ